MNIPGVVVGLIIAVGATAALGSAGTLVGLVIAGYSAVKE